MRWTALLTGAAMGVTLAGCAYPEAIGAALQDSAQASAERHQHIQQARALMRQADATSDPVEKLALLDQAQLLLHVDDQAYSPQAVQAPPASAPPIPPGQPIYAAKDCIGAIVNGVCHGMIAPAAQPQSTCYGSVINGICTGAQF